MALQGTIDSFPIADVLQLLGASSKTGRLDIEGDRGRGSLWVDEGRIISGDMEGAPPTSAADVVFEFFLFEQGSFEFLADDAPVERPFSAGTTEAVEAATSMLADWERIREVVPGERHVVSLAPSLDTAEVTIAAEEWSLLVACGPDPEVESLLETLQLGEFEGCRRIADLVERSLVVIGEPCPETEPRAALRPDDVVTSEEAATETSGTDPHEMPPTFDGAAADATASDTTGFDTPRFETAGFGSAGFETAASEGAAFEGAAFEGAAFEGVNGDNPRFESRAFESTGADTVAPDSTNYESAGVDGSGFGGQPDTSFTDDDGSGGVDAFPDHFPIDDLVGPDQSVHFDNVAGSAPAADAFTDLPAGSAGAFGPPEDPSGAAEPSGGSGADNVLAQIGRLSPKAAEAIAAALGDGEEG